MRKFLRHALPACALALLSLQAMPAWADFYIVVNKDSPLRTLTHKEAVALFMGRNRSLGNGEIAALFDLPPDSPQHREFYQLLTGLDPAQVNSYWSRLIFSGRSLPPRPLPDEATMAATLAHNPNAVGWLTKEPADKQLRTVLVLKEAP